MNRLFVQALAAFLIFPGTVAFLVPWWLLGAGSRWPFPDGRGLIPFLLGIVLLLWCVWAFYTTGKGTLAPWTPPRHLVVIGLYRFSRNPMYIAVLLVLSGWALGFHSRPLTIYAVTVALFFHLRVVLGEEPWLAR